MHRSSGEFTDSERILQHQINYLKKYHLASEYSEVAHRGFVIIRLHGWDAPLLSRNS